MFTYGDSGGGGGGGGDYYLYIHGDNWVTTISCMVKMDDPPVPTPLI